MSPAGLRAVRMLARRPGEVGELARIILEAEGERFDAGPSPTAEERRAYERDRKARQRAAKRDGVPDNVPCVPACPGDVPGPVPADVPGTDPLSSSPLSLVSDEKEQKNPEKRESVRASVPGTVPVDVPVDVPPSVPAPVSRTSLVDDGRPVSPGDVLPDELRAAAQVLGVRDIDGAWLKFVGHYAGRTIHRSGWWQKWCANERKREQKEPTTGTRLVQPTGPGGKRLWKVGGAP